MEAFLLLYNPKVFFVIKPLHKRRSDTLQHIVVRQNGQHIQHTYSGQLHKSDHLH